MSYFKYMNKVNYRGITVDNIFTKYTIPDLYYTSPYFSEYHINLGETPELVSYKLYGTTELWWAILLYLKKIDPFYEWLVDDEEMEKIAEKQAIQIHGPNYTMAQFTSLMDTLMLKNDSLRNIKVLSSASMRKVLKNIETHFVYANRVI